MSTEKRGPRTSLALQIFLICALVVQLAVVSSVAMTWLIGERIATGAVQQSLDNVAQAQAGLSKQCMRLLERSNEMIANDPALSAYLAAAIGDDLGTVGDAAPDVRSLQDLLMERKNQFGFDLGLLLDAKAGFLVRSDQGESLAGALDKDPLISAVMQRLAPQSGYWRFEDYLYQATVTPLTNDGALVGFLLLAQRIDDAESRDIARASGVEVVFWMAQADQAPRLLASSFPPERGDTLRSAFIAGNTRTHAGWGRTVERFDLKFAGQNWLVRSQPLFGEDGAELGSVSAMASGERVLSGYRQIFNLSLLSGSTALVVALPLSFWLSRRMLAPMRRLAQAAEASAAGDYERLVSMSGSDEISRLGDAFERLLSRLREKRDMESYLSEVSRSLPDRAGEASTTDIPMIGSGHLRYARQSELAIGGRVGNRYEVMAMLGGGGMGLVYKVRDLELGDLVALKLLRGATLQDAEQLERLKDEIRLARRITHPNVLRTFDFGEADGRAFITMEYVRGVTLRTLLKQSRRLPYGAGLRIARQLAAGLEAAHDAGVLHRDIKPENLILEANGNVKLMDFGIARTKHRDGEGLTQAGSVMGSPDYSSPEQLAGGVVDERSDIYSCGVLLSEVMCGKRPYQGSSPVEIYMAQMQNAMLRPSAMWPDVPPMLESIILRCLSAQPRDRYHSASEFGAALDQLRA